MFAVMLSEISYMSFNSFDLHQTTFKMFFLSSASIKTYREGSAMLSRRFMSVKEVSDLLQVGETTVRNWIRDCELPAFDVGREWRIAPKELEAFLETRRPQKISEFVNKAKS